MWDLSKNCNSLEFYDDYKSLNAKWSFPMNKIAQDVLSFNFQLTTDVMMRARTMIITKRAMMMPLQFLWLGFADTNWKEIRKFCWKITPHYFRDEKKSTNENNLYTIQQIYKQEGELSRGLCVYLLNKTFLTSIHLCFSIVIRWIYLLLVFCAE